MCDITFLSPIKERAWLVVFIMGPSSMSHEFIDKESLIVMEDMFLNKVKWRVMPTSDEGVEDMLEKPC